MSVGAFASQYDARAMSAAPRPDCNGAPPLGEASVAFAGSDVAGLIEPPRTDLGNAERLVASHGHDLRYVAGRGWLVWNGRRWRPDDDGEVMRCAKRTIRQLAHAAIELDDPKRGQLTKHALASESRRRLDAMIALATSEADVLARREALDADPWLLNVHNGTVDLRSGTLRRHERGDLMTRITGASYDPDAKCPTWVNFLARVLPDADVRAFLRRALGYGLTGLTTEQVLFVLHGGGSNGKTTLIETIEFVVGDYAASLPASSLLERRGADAPPNDLALLPGVRFAAASETGARGALNEERVKAITGSDTITARFLYREFFSFAPTHKLWLATNHLPAIRGTDEAIWRRIRLIPFEQTIGPDERDPDLPARLRSEANAIMTWAIEGCLEWQRDGLSAPAGVLHATSGYRDEMDVLGDFLAERCHLNAGATVSASALYAAYVEWCEKGRERPVTKTMLGRRLTERGLQKARPRGDRGWDGIELRVRA